MGEGCTKGHVAGAMAMDAGPALSPRNDEPGNWVWELAIDLAVYGCM